MKKELPQRKYSPWIFSERKLEKFLLSFLLIFFLSSCKDTDDFSPSEREVCFELINNTCLSIKENDYNIIRARGKDNHDGEGLVVERLDVNNYVIRAKSGLYLTYKNPKFIIVANEKKKANASIFQIVKVKEYYQLKTKDGVSFKLGQGASLTTLGKGKLFVFSIVDKAFHYKPWTSFNLIFFARVLFQLFILLIALFFFFKYIKKTVKNTLSLRTIIVVAFIGLISITNLQKWNSEGVISSDFVMYYQYLPAAIVFNDMSYSFLKDLPPDFNGKMWVKTNEKTGRNTNKFTMGMSIMYLPFFMVGHLCAAIFDYTAYGYSYPYLLALSFCGWFYSLLGFIFLRKILLTCFNDVITVWVLVSIALGTNLFYYLTIEPAMTHAVSFSLISMFMWFTVLWYNKKRVKTAVCLGLLLGVISLIRPTNGLIAVVFIFFNISSIQQMKERVLMFREYKIQVLLLTFFTILIWMPQLLFWKYSSGEWFYFSYGEEGFFFSNPQIFNGLFSYRKGWLIYTPIMIFALSGLVFTYMHNKRWVTSLMIFIPVNIFIIYSWWCWWYGGSFGSRPMIDSYAVMAIPLGFFYQFFYKLKPWLRSFPLLIMVLSISLNLFQTEQTKTCLHYDSMTKEAYWSNFTTIGWPNNYEELIAPPDYTKAIKGEEEYNLKK